MNLKKLFRPGLILTILATTLTAFGQSTIYVQSRSGGTSGGANNPDFVCTKFSATASGNKSSAPSLPGGSTSSRFVATPTNSTVFFTVSPNNTTAGQLMNGTTYAVAITFATSGTSGQAESTDIVVATSDTQTSGNDTFAGTTTAFKSGNGANTWITIGNVTINGALPTFTFAWSSGANVNRWYADTVRFTPLPPPATAQYWDTGSIGGTGIWDATTPNWNSSSTGSGTQGVYNQADTAVFGGTPGTVSIDPINGISTDAGLEFDTTGYIVQSGALTLGLGTNIAVVGSATTATINSVVTGVNGLSTIGLGTLALGGANTLSGLVTLGAGTLSLTTNQTFTSLMGNSSATLALNTNTLTVGDANNTTLASVITDTGASTPGSLVKQGSSILTLGGTSTFHGTTTVGGGTLTIGADAALGTAPSSPVASQVTLSNAARLDFSAAFTLNAKRGVTLGNGGGLLSTGGSGTTPTIAGTISGAGSLVIPSGGFDFTGTNTFTGNLYLVGTNVDATGNGLSSVRFDSTAASGAGKIFVMPGSAHNMTLRTFSYTNSVVTNAIEFDPFSGAGLFVSGAVASGKLCTLTLSGNINGTAGVIAGLTTSGGSSNPGGTVALSGSNSAWSGGLTLQYGNLALGSSNALGTGTFNIEAIDSGANLALLATAPLTGASAVTNATTISLASGTTFTIGGTNSLEISGPVYLVNSSTIIVTNTGDSILSGGINDLTPSFGYSLTLAGTGTLTISGASTYDGGTTVSSGTLKVNNTSGSGTGTGAVEVNSGATLAGSGIISGPVTVDGVISPGNSPGTLATADETWDGGGAYTWEINQAGGTAGTNPGWDLLNITGGLAVSSGFTINLTSLTPLNTAGPVSDFNNTRNYTWSIAHTTTGVAGFSPGTITVNTAAFANSLGGGSFVLSTNATDLLLSFIAPPSITTINVNTIANTVQLGGSGWTPNAAYRVLSSTNAAASLNTWTQFGSGTVDNSGNITFNGSINPAESQRYYIIVSP